MKLKVAFIDILGLVYDGTTLSKRGLGGSESAVILMSQELTRLGFEVTVFNNCNDKTSSEGIYDGVKYIDLTNISSHIETFDIVISSRSVIPFIPLHTNDLYSHMCSIFKCSVPHTAFSEIVNRAKHKILWMHDTFCSGDNILEELVIKNCIDEVFTLSDWHTTYVSTCNHGRLRNPEVLKRKIFVTRNGITRYHNEIDISKKDPNLFVYNASVTKGMIPLIEKIWPKVKQKIPNARLKVIGGFYKFRDDDPGDEQEQKFWQLYRDNENKNLDVEFTGIIKQSEIADILCQASYMIYPGAFPETFGISTLESLYYCTPLITTRFGALEETAIDDISYMIDYAIEPNSLYTDINHEEQVNLFVDAVTKAYHIPYLHQQKQHACRKIKDICGWDSVALQWKQHLYRLFNLHMPVNEYRDVMKINSNIHNIFGRRTMNKEEFTFPKSNSERRIIVVTPFYNAENYIEKCIRSVAAQDYDNYNHILIDDQSTDNSYTIARQTIDSLPPKLQDQFITIHNADNRGAVRNQIETIRQYVNNDDIVILLDGDDWLAYRNDIFTYINTLHHDGADFTYGSCWSLADNIPLISQEYPKAIRESKNFRDHKFNWGMPYTHLRTFRGSLLKHETDEPFTDETGQWYKAGGDNSVFYTAIENASNVVCVQEILYVYNDLNPLNDYKVNDEEQRKTANQIQRKKTMNKNELFTVVVPTMWKCPQITETMLTRLSEHSLVHQIIMFDNDPSTRPDWSILSHDKILLTKLGDEDKNYFVNPCWNKGVELSETNRVCIWNDDVEFDLNLFDKIHSELTPEKGVFGLVTGEEKFGHPLLTDGSIDFVKWNWHNNPQPGDWGDNIHGFGQLMFIRKENWIPIVDGLDIYFGDDFIFHSHLKQGLNNYLIANIRWSSPMACTSAIQEIVNGFYDREKYVYGDWALKNPVPFPISLDLKVEYDKAVNQNSDINEHLPILHSLAMNCDSITELGVASGESTRAFLYSKKKLRSYDLFINETVEQLFQKAKQLGVDCQYIIADTRTVDIEPTDLLFIDTLHNYDQVKTELTKHASKAKKYIAFHDTQSFGTRDETGTGYGIVSAIFEFLRDNPQWKIHTHRSNNNGLTVLSREDIPKKKILIGIPTNKYIETETFKSIYDLRIPNGYEVEFQYFYGYQIDQIRNLIAEWAKRYDYLFSVDSDIVLPPDTLEKMLAHNVDMVSGLYIQRIPDTHTLEVYKDNGRGGSTNIDIDEIDFSQPLHEIVGCGFGCVLIKGHLFREMEYPHFVYKSALDHKNTFSEDNYFCMKAREKGFKIYMDCTIHCEHIGSSKYIVKKLQKYSKIAPDLK